MNELSVLEKNNTQIEQYGLTPQMSVDSLKRQRDIVLSVMRDVMREGHDFGKIPGCGDKPTLYKPGAEKLSSIFGISPRFEIETTKHDNGHIDIRVICNLYSITNDRFLGAGLGSCSTLESKYRYRSQNTGQPVPQEYWQNRDSSLLGGHQFSPRKIDGKWFIFEKIEHDNPLDYGNTVLKMAKKRAQIDAILTVTAASDIFTQDIEDLQNMMGEMEKRNNPPAPQSNEKQQKTEPTENPQDYFTRILDENFEKIRTKCDLPDSIKLSTDLLPPLMRWLGGNLDEKAMQKAKKDNGKFIDKFCEHLVNQG